MEEFAGILAWQAGGWGWGQWAQVSRRTLAKVTSDALYRLRGSALCDYCSETFDLRDASHCPRCERELLSLLQCPLWTRSLQLRFVITAVRVVDREHRRGAFLPWIEDPLDDDGNS